MKKMNSYRISDTLMTECMDIPFPHVPEQDGVENTLYQQLQHALMERTVLRRILTTSQQRIEILEETNIRQRQKLIRLAEKLMQAHRFGYYDELTGLPNRRLLFDRFKQAMAQSNRQHKRIALLFIDLDKFKSINDELGHTAGDKLLQQFAEHLITCIRYGDTACRYGGDEFVIMLPEIDNPKDAAVVAEKIHARLSEPYVVDDTAIVISASIGTTIYPADGKNCSELIKQADISMYLAKTRSKLPIVNRL